MNHLFLILTIFATATCCAHAQIAVGGNYTIEKSVTANGGASGTTASVNGTYTIEGTIGQSAAGTTEQASSFKFQPGFWHAATPLGPTAASVNLGGRVTMADGRGITNARVTLTMPDGTTRTMISGSFGYYRFEDVEVGATYILTATAKRFVFSIPTQIVSLNDVRDDVDFIAVDSF